MRIVHYLEAERASNKALFELIEDTEHWKNPIHASIPKFLFKEFNDAVIY